MALWYLGKNHTADNVLIAQSPEGLKIALIERNSDPFKGCYAFPGGFLNTSARPGSEFKIDIETPKQAALRELQEETTLDISSIPQFSVKKIGHYDDIERDPRNTERAHVASTAFLIFIPEPVPLKPADDAATAHWYLLTDVLSGDIKLAFDHETILSDAVKIYGVSD